MVFCGEGDLIGGKETDLQLVLPTEFQADVLRSFHEGATSAHLGEEKMLQQLKERFYWPGCTDAVKDYCATCAIYMLHTEISCSEAEGGSTNNPGWISITNSLCGLNEWALFLKQIREVSTSWWQ